MENNKKMNRESGKNISILEFCDKNIKSFGVVVIILIIAYGMKIFHLALSHDTEAIISVPDSLYNSWMTMGRFGLIAIKKVCGLFTFNPYLASIFMFLVLILNAFVWEYLFFRLDEKREKFARRSWIFPSLFLTAPVMAEQISFLLQAFEVSLAILLVGIALILIWTALIDNIKWYYVPAVLLLAISFSCYQTTVPLFIAAAIACFLLSFDYKDEHWKSVFTLIAAFVGSFLIYQIVNKIIMYCMNITTTSYISEQILWGNTSIKDCLKNIMRHIWNALTANGIYYSLAFPISIIMLVIMTIWQIRKRSKDLYLYILAALVLLLTPFLMTILMGQMPKYRTQIVLPFVFGFIIQYFVGRTELFNSRKISQLLFLLGIGVLVLGIQQSMTAAQMFYSEYVQYEEDVRIATKITDRIDQLNLGERPSEPLIFIGSRSPQLNRSSSNSFENPGHSFFEWAFTTQYGTFIMENFLATIGYNYESPTLEQIAFAESYSKDMKIWPDTESVQVADGVIIVKLSDI